MPWLFHWGKEGGCGRGEPGREPSQQLPLSPELALGSSWPWCSAEAAGPEGKGRKEGQWALKRWGLGGSWPRMKPSVLTPLQLFMREKYPGLGSLEVTWISDPRCKAACGEKTPSPEIEKSRVCLQLSVSYLCNTAESPNLASFLTQGVRELRRIFLQTHSELKSRQVAEWGLSWLSGHFLVTSSSFFKEVSKRDTKFSKMMMGVI